MRTITFLDLPATIRMQIYTELLTPRASPRKRYVFQPEDIATSILYTNRQIYAESSDVFYSRNLFVVIKTDSHTLAHMSKLRIGSYFPSVGADRLSRVALPGRFAMSVELLSIGWQSGRKPRLVQPVFVITAEAMRYFMKHLLRAIEKAKRVFISRFELHNTFRYTSLRCAELLFGSVTSLHCLPALKALIIGGPVHQNYRQRLMAKILHDQDRIWFDFAGAYALSKLYIQHRMLPQNVYSDLAMRKNFEDLRYLLQALKIVWDFHNTTAFQHIKHYAKATLFQCVAELYSQLALAHLIEAKRHPEQAYGSYSAARHAAENGIVYLTSDYRLIDQTTFDTFPASIKEENMNLIGRAKATLSLKASKACVKLGDKPAARAYIFNAHRQDRNMSPSVHELCLKLEWKHLPDSSEADVGWKPVLWNG